VAQNHSPMLSPDDKARRGIRAGPYAGFADQVLKGFASSCGRCRCLSGRDAIVKWSMPLWQATFPVAH